MNNLLKVLITVKNPHNFLMQIIKNNINIYNLEKNNKTLIIVIDLDGYDNLLKIKSTAKIKIIDYYGIIKYKYFFKQYKYLFLFFTLIILIIIFLSNIIFKVEIINKNEKLVNIIQKDLYSMGIKPYSLKKTNKKIKLIKEKILEKEKDKLLWLEIENIGTKYIIKVEEKKKNKNINKCYPRHIVASKKAIIKEIVSSSGEVLLKEDDYVNKNDIIISGFIYNKEKVVSKRCSKGVVYGEVWYKVKLSFPKLIIKTKVLNSNHYGFSINIFNNNIYFLNTLEKYQVSVYNIVEDQIIPLSLGFSKYMEKVIIKDEYSIKDIDKKALQKAEYLIYKKLSKDEKIISKKILKKAIKDSKIEVEVFLKVKENITSYQDISSIDINDLNKEE